MVLLEMEQSKTQPYRVKKKEFTHCVNACAQNKLRTSITVRNL